MKTWAIEHWQACARAFAGMRHAWLSTLLNVLVIGIALALPLSAYTLLANVERATAHAEATPEISVFMAADATRAQAKALQAPLRALTEIASTRFVPREDALETLKTQGALGDIASTLGANPLPDAWIVTLKRYDAPLMSAHATTIRALPKVEIVQIDSAWVERVGAVLKFGRLGVLLLGLALSLALIAVTVNTIRLSVLTQRDEIEVAQLLGATAGYIRRPFFYAGALTGVGGGLVAVVLVWGTLTVLAGPVGDLARSYGAAFGLAMLPWRDLVTALGFAALLGWLGASLSVSQQLRVAR